MNRIAIAPRLPAVGEDGLDAVPVAEIVRSVDRKSLRGFLQVRTLPASIEVGSS